MNPPLDANMTLTPIKTIGELTIYSRPKNRPKGVKKYVVFRGVISIEEFTRYSVAHSWCRKQVEAMPAGPALTVQFLIEDYQSLGVDMTKDELVRWASKNANSLRKQIQQLGLVVVYNQLRMQGKKASLSLIGTPGETDEKGPTIILPQYAKIQKVDLSVVPPMIRVEGYHG